MVDFLIIARSGRALATSACRAGYKVIAIDCFSDVDTKSVSESSYQVRYNDDGFDVEQLLAYVREIITLYPDIKILPGSGYESNPQLAQCLGELASLLGNHKQTIEFVKDPHYFFSILKKLAISFPEVSFSRPDNSNRYLLKKVAGMGGEHVNWSEKINFEQGADYYYQEYVPGIISSVVFLANGTETRIVGFNQQLQCDEFTDMPFLYQGAIRLKLSDVRHKDVIENIINNITLESGLKGLCGLDYIVNKTGKIIVLEINPRPPATFELFDDDFSLFDAHINCFAGKLPAGEKHTEMLGYNGYVIFYAKGNLLISDKIQWPDWVKDIPETGSMILEKYPVCTVHAADNSLDKLKRILFNRLQQIETAIIAAQDAA